jgi:DMSO/TMAO reductase YedYZ molybdopterin-dependent catalytic subunit
MSVPEVRNRAIVAGERLVVCEEPFNAETPLRLLSEPATPDGAFYVRCNFAIPEIDPVAFRLAVTGEVERPLDLDLATIRGFPAAEVVMTMECAGNGRARMARRAPGTPWDLGAVSTARFRGTPLRSVLDEAGVGAATVEILCTGADGGEVDGRTMRFERSLPLGTASRPDVIVAWEMNGMPLPPEHGAPLRLVVPGWYGVASVKWLVRLRAITEPFRGFFQHDRYVYNGEPGLADGTPVRRVRVRSLITAPGEGNRLPDGRAFRVQGVAWSGERTIARVEVSADGGRTWRDARLDADPGPGIARGWSIECGPPASASVEIVARATDDAGERQPTEPVWNELGYGNNAAHRVQLRVDGG